MRSKALLAKSALLKTPKAVDAALPVRVADLGVHELIAHCDRCGRHLHLHPATDLEPRTHLVSLLERLVCGARRNGRACGGLPRRLVLMRDERRWMLDASGEWSEDESVFWELVDFEARAAAR